MRSNWNPFDHHRGPYRLQIIRLGGAKKAPWSAEPLRGATDSGDEIEAEARALLDDPRDTIVAVAVWSVSEQQHVTTFKKEGGR